MGLGFLAPAILAGLAALAIPLYFHLTHRERKEDVQFPSLMFLERIPYRSVRRQRIRHPLLLALRLLGVALLVAAFARPVLERSELTAAGVGPSEVVILLDRSHSMGYGDRWDEALAAARELVAGLGPEDRASLLFFSTGAAAPVRSTTDRNRLLASLDTVSVSARPTRFGPALQLAAGILEESEFPSRRAYFISDMQRGGWDGDEGIRFPPGAVLTPLPVGVGETPSNLAVTGVTFQRDRSEARERVTVSARVVATGPEPVRGRGVALELDGRVLEVRSVDVEPGASSSVTFAPITLTDPFTRGTVRAEADALPADDVFHFVLSPGDGIPVLLVESGALDNPGLYLREALSIGDDPPFRVESRRVDALQPGDFAGRRVVILHDTRPPVGAAGEALARWVEGGGGLLVALGERSAWPEAAPDLLPGSFSPPRDRRERRGGALGFVETAHPIFELFASPRSGDLTAARFFRTRTVSPVEGAEVLARFDDGEAALVERRVGRGRVLLWASTLDTFWNDLPLQPVYLPLMRRSALYLADHRPTPAWHTAGGVAELSGRAALGGDGVDTPYPERIALPPGGGAPIPLVPVDHTAFLSLDEQGFYLVRGPGEAPPRPFALAVNLDPGESDLTPMDPAELAASVASRTSAAEGVAAGGLSREDRERRQSGWWYLLLGALVLLGVETVAANRLSRSVAA